jgi:hypothetical protein
VNDVFVLDAWAKASGARDTVTFLANGDRDFAKSIGLEMDGTPSGLGIRSKRYAMLVEDGVVTALHVVNAGAISVQRGGVKSGQQQPKAETEKPLREGAFLFLRHREAGQDFAGFGINGFSGGRNFPTAALGLL